MTIPISPVEKGPVKFAVMVDSHEVVVKVPEPLLLEAAVPESVLRTILVRSMVVLMAGSFAAMLILGLRKFNPMMIASMLGMLGMLGGAMGSSLLSGKNTQGELDTKRQTYITDLREQRRNAHVVNRHVHATQVGLYSHPGTLVSRCGDPHSMWTTPRTEGAQAEGREAAENPQTSPWGTARIGPGYRRAVPYIKPAAVKAPEAYEPVTAAAYMRFVRTQNVIANCPIGVDLVRPPFVVYTGDSDKVLGSARAMICSIVTTHAPSGLQVGIITVDLQEWDWMKWLPHCADPSRRDAHRIARLHWRDVQEFAIDQHESIATSGPRTTGDSSTPHRVIFVDTPDSEPLIPPGIGPQGLANHTFVYIRRHS